MSHYSDDPNMCRVDVWKDSGKWYETIAVRWPDYSWEDRSEIPLIHEQFQEALIERLRQQDGTIRLAGMRATCLEPYHPYSHPVSVIIPSTTFTPTNENEKGQTDEAQG